MSLQTRDHDVGLTCVAGIDMGDKYVVGGIEDGHGFCLEYTIEVPQCCLPAGMFIILVVENVGASNSVFNLGSIGVVDMSSVGNTRNDIVVYGDAEVSTLNASVWALSGVRTFIKGRIVGCIVEGDVFA
ncbi:hypothetical protein X975_13033, partial [Stegodyphus mimosarum]